MRTLKWIVAGYLVDQGKVLLVHHNKQNKWVPCGGHIEENETPTIALAREYREELGLEIEVLDAVGQQAFEDQGIWTSQPKPFHIDIEDMTDTKYDHDLLIEFFYVKLRGDHQKIQNQLLEIKDSKWFSLKDLQNLDTYPQVIALAKYALKHHPYIQPGISKA